MSYSVHKSSGGQLDEEAANKSWSLHGKDMFDSSINPGEKAFLKARVIHKEKPFKTFTKDLV